MKLSSKRMASLLLARFARAVVAADMAPGLAVKAGLGEVLAMLRRGANKHALRRFAETTLSTRFDFKQMARQATGNAWLAASSQQKRALEKSFREWLLDVYATALRSAAGSDLRFEVKPVRHSNPNDVTVNTLINGAVRPGIAIDFKMQNQRQGWIVCDVLVDGMSVTEIYRETFAAEVRRLEICASVRARDATQSRRAIMLDPHASARA